MVSGKHIGIVDPHRKCIPKDSRSAGWKGKLSSILKHVGHASCFDGIFDLTSETTKYAATLFRFPLRQNHSTSEISSNAYSPEKVKENLFESLKTEASVIMLFLKNISKISLYEWDASNHRPTQLFAIEADDKQGDILMTERKYCQQIAERYSQQNTQATLQVLTTSFVEKAPHSQHKAHHWLILNIIGSDDAELRQLGDELHVLPWVGIAAPLPTQINLHNCHTAIDFISAKEAASNVLKQIGRHLQSAQVSLPWEEVDKASTKGQAFCFLPLPGHTALPVHIHGYFAVADNRRSVKWPTHDEKGDHARWNRLLLHKLIAPTYTILLGCRSSLIKYLGAPTHSSNSDYITDPYAAWPLHVEVKNQLIWSEVLQPTLEFASELPILWTLADGGKWVKLTDAYYLPGSFRKSTTKPCPMVAIDLLVQAGKPIVCLPTNITETLSSCEELRSLLSEREITPGLVRSVLKQPGHLLLDFHGTLEYILSDLREAKQYTELVGIPLLPLNPYIPPAKFEIKFPNGSNAKYVFTASLADKLALLPGIQHVVVDLSCLPKFIQTQLTNIASSRMLQLQLATPEIIATTLLNLSISSWCGQNRPNNNSTWIPGESSHPELQWINKVWQWLNTDPLPLTELSKYQLPIIPQQSTTNRLRKYTLLDLPPLGTSHLCTLPDVHHISAETLKAILQKLGFIVVEKSPVVFSHKEISKFVPTITPELVVREIQSQIAKIKFMSDVEKNGLREFIASHYGRNHVPQQYQECLRSLPIYKAGVGKSSPVLVKLQDSPSSCILPPTISALPPNVVYPETWLIRDEPLVVKLINNLSIQQLHHDTFCVKFLIPFAAENHHVKVILWVLQNSNISPASELHECLTKTAIVKTRGKHQTFVKPQDLFDPQEEAFQVLFGSESENTFPAADYTHLLPKLRDLGLKTWNSVKANRMFIQGRAESVQHCNPNVGLKRSKFLLRVILQRSDQLWESLSDTQFLFPQKSRPKDYPSHVQWFGEGHSGLNTIKGTCLPTRDNPYLVGSVIPILSEEYDTPTRSLQMFYCPQVAHVIQQLSNLVKSTKSSGMCLERVNYMTVCIYAYLSTHAQEVFKDRLPVKWIWWQNKDTAHFMSENRVILKIPEGMHTDLEPYRFAIARNNELQRFKPLFKHCGVRSTIDHADCLDILQEVRETNPNYLSDHDLNIVCKILEWLHDQKFETHSDILMPTETHQLLLAKYCTFDDRNWLKQKTGDGRFKFVHWRILPCLAKYFKVKPLSERVAPSKKLAIKYTVAGPYEKLTHRIKRIVQEYGSSIDIFKELIQNADDAMATEIKFLVDWREHSSSSLLAEELKPWQGPALLAYNNAVFSDQDFDHICQLAGQTKLDDPLKTGRFGVGFCATYHLTDLPSFISQQYFTMFDPHTTYLGDRVSTREPGMRIDLIDTQEDLKIYEHQFLPYKDIFGCNVFTLPKDGYKGSLFRFPFRNNNTSLKSEISGRVYAKSDVDYLIRKLKESTPEILLFLKHISRISVYEIPRDASSPAEMKEILTVEKTYLEGQGKRTTLMQEYTKQRTVYSTERQCCCKVQLNVSETLQSQSQSSTSHSRSPSSTAMQSQWLLCSALGTSSSEKLARKQGIKQGLIPLAEVALNLEHPECASVDHYKPGCDHYIFCFLPLPIKSGLPVHINGFFDVAKDRRSLSATDDGTFGSQWNKALGEDALTEAFAFLLNSFAAQSHMQELHDKQSFLKSYYFLWHLKSARGMVPEALRQSFRYYLQTTQLKLLWSEVRGGCWLAPCDAVMLQTTLREEIRRDAITIMLQQHCKVVEVPRHIQDVLTGVLQKKKQLYTYQKFCEEVLFRNLEGIHSSLRDKQVVFLLEKVYEDSGEYTWAKKLLMENSCIPCEGTTRLSTPERLVDCRKPHLKSLYDVVDGRFPSDVVQKSCKAMIGLVSLGMASYQLHLDDLKDRASTVTTLASIDLDAAYSRSLAILQYLQETYHTTLYGYSIRQSSKEEEVKAVLQDIPFLPALKLPSGVQLPWFNSDHFVCPSQVYPPRHKHLVFSQCPIVDVPDTIITVLGIAKKQPFPDLVLQHFSAVIAHLSDIEASEVTKEYIHQENVMEGLYKYYTSKYTYSSQENVCIEQAKSTLSSQKFIWQDGHLLRASQVLLKWQHDHYPYLCGLSASNMRFRTLFESLGVKETASVETLAEVLKNIRDDHNDPIRPLSSGLLSFTGHVVGELCSQMILSLPQELYLPDEGCIMRPASELACDNLKTEWVHKLGTYKSHFDGGEGHFVHNSISRERAEMLGARPVLDAILKDIEDPEFLAGTDYGQHEDLCDRLNSILRKYPADSTIFQEFIQNADDAQASEIIFILDHRDNYPDEKLFSHGKAWKNLQKMPALCIVNNRKFSERDIEGITRLGKGAKDQSPEMIGKFGIGFTVSYHLTDCPSFLSCAEGGVPENLCTLDPTCRFVHGASKANPGRRWKVTEEHVKELPEQFSPYLARDLPQLATLAPNCMQEIDKYGYVVFRLPLTRMDLTKQQCPDYTKQRLPSKVRSSRNKLSNKAFGPKEVLKLFHEFRATSKDMLLFLNNLRHISVFEITRDGKYIHHFTNSVSIPSQYLQQCDQFSVYTKKVFQDIKPGMNPKPGMSASHQVKVLHVESRQCPSGDFSVKDTTSWLVQRNVVMDRVKPALLQTALEHSLRPIGGIAAQLSLPKPSIEHHVFCFLPMPLLSLLPVHVNGHFVVDDSRKHFEKVKHEGLSEWNQSLINHVIAPTYADFILKAKQLIGTLSDGQKWFYQLFPGSDPIGELGELKLVEALYKEMLSRNEPILLCEQTPQSDCQPLKWLKVTEAYFCVRYMSNHTKQVMGVSNSLRKALIALEMPITSAPEKLHQCFQSVEKNSTLVVTHISVALHLQQLNQSDKNILQILRANIESILQFLINGYKTHLPDILQAVPLLVASDGFLQKARTIFESRYSALLPNCPHCFIDTTLEQSNVGVYLRKLDIIIPLPPEFVARMIQLPDSEVPVKVSADVVSSIQMEQIKLLWQYLKSYPFQGSDFSTCVRVNFSHKPIMPSSDGRLFPVCVSKAILNESGDQRVRNVMRNLGYPFLDFKTIGLDKSVEVNVTAITSSCSSADEVLECIQFQDPTNCDVTLSEDHVHAFITFITGANAVGKAANTLVKFPLFQSIDGTMISVDKATNLFILPPEMPQDGVVEVTKQSNYIVLKPAGLHVKFYQEVIPNFSSAVVSAATFYTLFLIPNIYHLTEKCIQKHIQYISDHQVDSKLGNGDSELPMLQQALKETPFIHHCGKCHLVSDFLDPAVEFFKQFHPDKLLPKTWCVMNLLPFLRTLGLNEMVTHDEWLHHAQLLADSASAVSESPLPIPLIQKAATLLRSLLHYTSDAAPNLQKLEDVDDTLFLFLKKAREIPFIPSPPSLVERAISSFSPSVTKQNSEHLICFKGSVFNADSNLACLCRPVLPEDCALLPPNSEVRRVALQIETPLIVDTVIINLLKLGKSLTHNCAQKQASFLASRDDLTEILTSHYACLDKMQLQDQLKKTSTFNLVLELKRTACILLDKERKLLLVTPSQMVKQIPADTHLEPFCHRVPLYFHKYPNLLKALGVPDQLKASRCAEILNEVMQETEQCGMQLCEDQTYLKVAESAYNELIRCLRQGDSPKIEDLYLLSQQDELLKADELVYNDVPWYANRLKKMSTFKFLRPPIHDSNGQRTLPDSLGVRHLSTIITEELHDDMDTPDISCQAQLHFASGRRLSRCNSVQNILATLNSEELYRGLLRIYHHDNEKMPTEEFQKIARRLTSVEVKCIEVDLKTVLYENGRAINGTAESVSCHLMITERNTEVLYISPHIDTFDQVSFLKKLSGIINRLLLRQVKNEASIASIFECEPSQICLALDKHKVTPFDPVTDTPPSRGHQIGDVIPLEEITHQDLLVFVDYQPGEDIFFLTDKGILKYAVITKTGIPHHICEKTITVKTFTTTTDDDGNESKKEDMLQVSPLRVIKILTPSQRTSLSIDRGTATASSFATPVVLADVPCSTLQRLQEWIQNIYEDLHTQLLSDADELSGNVISLNTIRLIGHLHYYLVMQNMGRDLFTPAVMEIQNLVCQTDLPSCMVDPDCEPELSQAIDALTMSMEELELKDDGDHDTDDSGRDSSPIPFLSDEQRSPPDISAMPQPRCIAAPIQDKPRYGYGGSRTSTTGISASTTNPAAIRQGSSQQQSSIPHQIVQQPHQQPRFPSQHNRRGHRSVSAPRFPSVQIQQTEPPKPPICMQSAQIWMDQAKADYRAAHHLLQSMGEEQPMEVECSAALNPTPHSSQFPALICFLCHETVEKSIKGVQYAFSGLRQDLLNSSRLVSLIGPLKESDHVPDGLKQPVEECVMQVNEHENKSRLPNFQIPPCAPAAVYTHHDACEAFSAVGKLMQCLMKDEKLKDLLGDLEHLPRPRFRSTLKSMREGSEGKSSLQYILYC